MTNMDWTSPDGIAALAAMKKNGNLPKVVANKIRKNRVWVESHQRGGVDVEGHFRNIGSKIRDAAHKTAPQADFQNIDAQSATRAAAYGGIGAGALGLGAHYVRARPSLAAAYGLYGLANLFGAGHQAHQAATMQKSTKVEKVREVKDSKEFDAFMEEMSEASGIRPEQIIEDFGEWLRENKISADEVDEEVFHEFMVTTYGHEEEPDPKALAKHLIGRHNQEDHDPTQKQTLSPGDSKRKVDHSRNEHSGLLRRGPTKFDLHRAYARNLNRQKWEGKIEPENIVDPFGSDFQGSSR